MGTHLCYLDPVTGVPVWEDEETTERSLFVDSNSSSYLVPDISVLGMTKEGITQQFIDGEITYDRYHELLGLLLEEDSQNAPDHVKISYVDDRTTVTEGFLF